MNCSIMRIPALAVLSVALLAGCERPPVDSTQVGFRGTGMVEISNPRTQASTGRAQRAPAVDSGDPGRRAAGEGRVPERAGAH